MDEAVEIWSKQGRTEEQIWAVKNFLTGAGEKVVKEAYERGLQDEGWNCHEHVEKDKAEARAEGFKEGYEQCKNEQRS